MKITPHRPSVSLLISLLALFIALGGSALAYNLGRNSVSSRQIAPHSVRASDLGALKLRSGRIDDRDTTGGDGVFNFASGHAQCKPGEQLVSGGVRLRATSGVFPGHHASIVESGPVPNQREWAVTLNSDLGGAARSDFVVFAYCLAA
jgi:hypothetical protein